ncbi:MAG: tetratricopeptide repeat protein, partial [Candidatus Omnitrophica bacterium]|nr:tetratricopeptide repeat protein [Candidatus Omnitrophota bacterium]
RLSHPKEKLFKAASMKLMGGVCFREQNIEAAYDYWRRALVLDPQDYELILNLSVVQMGRGKYDEAVQGFLKVLDVEPENPKALSNLGFTYYFKGDYVQAIQYLEKALGLLSKRSQDTSDLLSQLQPYMIYKRLGAAYSNQGEGDKAIAVFKKACELYPSLECSEDLGRSYFKNEMWDQAIGEWMKILKDKKTDPNIYGLLGSAYERKGDIPQSISCFRRGLALTKDEELQANFYASIGHLYIQSRQLDSALKEFQMAIAKDWRNVEGHFGMALVYHVQNRLEDSRRALNHVLNLDPSNKKARELLAKIETEGPR